jgi:hypothetical protein
MRHLASLVFSLFFATSVGAQTTEPRLAGAPTHRTCSPEEIQQALAGEFVGTPCRFTNLPEQPAHVSANYGRESALRLGAETSVSGRDDRSHMETRSISTHRSMSAQRANERSVVTLPDSFFRGSQTGGVERYSPPLYSYRGLILIAADGRVSYGASLLAHRSNIVRAMDRVGPTPPRSNTQQRAYPAY